MKNEMQKREGRGRLEKAREGWIMNKRKLYNSVYL